MVKKIKFIRGGEDMKLAIGTRQLAVHYGRLMRLSGIVKAHSITLITLITLITGNTCFAQSDRTLAREGNKLYNDKKYSDAEVKYKKALAKNNNLIESKFNLGDAYYKQEKYDDAAQQYQDVIALKPGKSTLTKAYHNLGNALLKSKKYQESIDAYKKALINNPTDNDTRYNLAYAQNMLREQQQKQQQQQNQNQNQNQKDKKQQQQQKQQQKQQQQQQQQNQAQKKPEISKEDAERILQALNNDEKNKQKKFQKHAMAKVQIEKDW